MIRTLQSLRFIFSLTVLLAHFNYAGREGYSTGVSIVFFTFLSGFVLSKAYGRRLASGEMTGGAFLKRRFIKLYPMHLLCLVAYIAVHHAVLTSQDIAPAMLNALLLQSWSTTYYFSMNSVSWYLSDVVLFLLLFPALYKCISRMNIRQLVLSAAALLAVYIAYMLLLHVDDLNYWLYIFPPVRLADFIIGIMMWRACELLPTLGCVRHHSAVELLLCAAILALMIAYPIDEKWHIAFLYWLVAVPMFFVFFRGESEGGIVSALLKTKPMLWLSRITMEAFLCHMLVFDVIMAIDRRVSYHLPYFAMMAVSFSAALAVAWLAKRYYVTPVTEYLSRKLTK